MLKKVVKPTARRLYNEGKTVYCIPCRLNLEGGWNAGLKIQGNFDVFCNSAEYYNCTAKAGRYLHFWVKG